MIEWLETICDSCAFFVKIRVAFLARIDGGILFEGIICPKCGNVLIFDGTVVNMAAPIGKRGKSKVKKSHKKTPKVKKWKIIEKGKVKPNESSS